MPPVVEAFVNVFHGRVRDYKNGGIMDQDVDYKSFAECVEHLAWRKDDKGNDIHGGAESLVQGEPVADLVISLMHTVPRLILELHPILVTKPYWRSLCTRAQHRVKQATIEMQLKVDDAMGTPFKELMRILRGVFVKAPKWYPEPMKYFLNAISQGPHRLRGVVGMEPVIDLLLNLAWHEVFKTRHAIGHTSDENPIGIFIPAGRLPHRLEYLEDELMKPWEDMYEWPSTATE